MIVVLELVLEVLVLVVLLVLVVVEVLLVVVGGHRGPTHTVVIVVVVRLLVEVEVLLHVMNGFGVVKGRNGFGVGVDVDVGVDSDADVTVLLATLANEPDGAATQPLGSTKFGWLPQHLSVAPWSLGQQFSLIAANFLHCGCAEHDALVGDDGGT